MHEYICLRVHTCTPTHFCPAPDAFLIHQWAAPRVPCRSHPRRASPSLAAPQYLGQSATGVPHCQMGRHGLSAAPPGMPERSLRGSSASFFSWTHSPRSLQSAGRDATAKNFLASNRPLLARQEYSRVREQRSQGWPSLAVEPWIGIPRVRTQTCNRDLGEEGIHNCAKRAH